MSLRLALFGTAFAALAAGCATTPAAAPPALPGVIEMLERPAERALVDGIRAYDDAQYQNAEAALRRALQLGLKSGRDQAAAYKLIAFITCTSDRIVNCEAAFRAARAADPAFALSRSEAGHPVWGPAYRRALP
jgi:hypothetical protein